MVDKAQTSGNASAPDGHGLSHSLQCGGRPSLRPGTLHVPQREHHRVEDYAAGILCAVVLPGKHAPPAIGIQVAPR